MRILGIDPGLNVTGYGAVERQGNNFRLIEAGLIQSPEDAPLAERLSKIHEGIGQVLLQCRPDLVVLEELYSHYRHPRTAILMGHARGVILSACSESRLPTQGYSPKRIRQAVTGNGNASKGQVQRVICTLLSLQGSDFPLDISDALVLAVGHLYLNGSPGKGSVGVRASRQGVVR